MKRKGILCFLKKDQQILLAQIDYGNGNIVWNGISGFMEPNEESVDALVREVKEEIGIDVDRHSVCYRGKRVISKDLDLEIFIASGWNGVPAPMEESIKKVKWFEIDALPFEEMFPGNEDWILDFIK